MPSQEEIDKELSQYKDSPDTVDDNAWINPKGVKIPDIPIVRGVVSGVRKFTHGATAGLDEKAAALLDTAFGVGDGDYTEFGKRYAQNEARGLGRAKEDSARLGVLSPIVEFGGALASPLNRLLGMGTLAAPVTAGKGAANLAANMGKFGAIGAGTGATFSTLGYLGEKPSDEMTLGGAGEAAGTGAKWGGGLGLLGGAGLSALEHYRPRNELKAIGATAGAIDRPGKVAGIPTQAGRIDKAYDLAQYANNRDLTGQKAFQGMESTVGAARTESDRIGKALETVRGHAAIEARKAGAPSVGNAGAIRQEVEARALADIYKSGSAILPSHQAAADNVLAELSALGSDHAPVTLDKLYEVYTAIHRKNKGHFQDRAMRDSELGVVYRNAERALSGIFDDHVYKVNPDTWANIKILKNNYHKTQAVESMAAEGLKGELGQREGGGLMPSLRGTTAALLSNFGMPGRMAAYAIGTKASQRGVMPNTFLHLSKNQTPAERLTQLTSEQIGKTIAERNNRRSEED